MQLPSVDRQPGMRPAGADLVPATGTKVVPVAPVNPPVTSEATSEPQPSVVNRIGENSQEPSVVYSSAPEPARRSAEAQDPTSPRDWTIQRAEKEEVKEEQPPPEPISKMLMEFIKSVWRASGGVVEASQTQAQTQAAMEPSNLVTGQVATENITYVPSKINRNEAV